MKLFNQTKISDEVLHPIIVRAGQAMKARTKKVVVIVRQGRYWCTHGEVNPAIWVYREHCQGKHWRKLPSEKLHKECTDGGYMILRLPNRCNFKDDYISLAQDFYKTTLHEWKHVEDLQYNKNQRINGKEKRPWKHYENGGKRQIAWGKRPQEIRAIDATDQVMEKGFTPRVRELILNLAVAFEERIKE